MFLRYPVLLPSTDLLETTQGYMRGSFTNTNNCSEWMKPKQRNHIDIKPGSDLIDTFVVELGGNINDLNAIDGISTSFNS